MGTLMLSSKGVAAIPRASLIVLVGTLVQYGLPGQAVSMIMGIDAIMDMGRTSINVFGNCLGSCIMARIEGSFRGADWQEEELERQREQMQEPDALDGDVSSDSLLHDDTNEELSDVVVVHHHDKSIPPA
ncbi:uncharacterized protein BYT42DRAFT_4180 [Radiomyces spectabilis]|uniref:uncharacterized protein n=1 Tax=Radiomyces spectabilis TaxID=64574 RepID=UPI00221F07DD|nr:uncharacterized protein BYT42DRAFT_4180 [Radiomyces spectabilis]KAI8393381.1 hypothetical protein BYT42DRAFT_4180 [Radiomyces spectabilis]